MERRTFLGAAAALAALPADLTRATDTSERQADKAPPSSRRFPERTGDMGEVVTPDPLDRDGPHVSINGHSYPDWPEDSHVEVTIDVGDRHVWLAFLPDEAATIGEDLAAAAEHAAGGGGEAGGAE